MARYIDADVFSLYVEDLWKRHLVTTTEFGILQDALNAQPSAADVRPVVRCRDCKFLGFKDFRGICEHGPVCGPITPDSFCSWGEMKKDGDDDG